MTFDNIKIKEIVCVLRYIPDRKFWKAENRNCHIIGIQTQGKAAHALADKNFTIEAQNIYFLNQRDEYSTTILEQTEAYSVHFTTYEPIDCDSFTVKINNCSQILSVIGSIEKALLCSDGKNAAFKNFYELCERFNNTVQKEYRPTDKRLQKVKEYIDLHFREKDCLHVAVKTFGVTQRRFNDIFKQHTDSTPNNYILEKKCELAKNLLTAKMASVSQIAEMCGFSDIYYFSKVFKKRFGVSPSKYGV